MNAPGTGTEPSGWGGHPSLHHPLMGARPWTLVSAFVRLGMAAPRHWPRAGAMRGSALGRAPVHLVEGRRLRRLREARGRPEAPVFIVGHGRSGTPTRLRDLMACSRTSAHVAPLASGLPDQRLTLATWFRLQLERALSEDRPVDRVAVRPGSPQEDEIPLASQQLPSVFHAVAFPAPFEARFRRGAFFEGASDREIAHRARCLSSLLEKVALQGGRPVPVKNLVYIGSIDGLRSTARSPRSHP